MAIRATLGRLFARKRMWQVFIGLSLCLISAVTLLTVLGLNTGGLAMRWTTAARQIFGLGILPACLLAIGAGAVVFLRPLLPPTRNTWTRLIAAEVAFLSLLALMHTLAAFGADAYSLARQGDGGGIVGWVLAEVVWRALGAQSNAGVTPLRLLSALIWLIPFALGTLIAATSLRQLSHHARHAGPASPAADVAAPTSRPASPANAETSSAPIRGEQLPLPDPVKPTARSATDSAVGGAARRQQPGSIVKSEAVIVKPDEPARAAETKSKSARAKPTPRSGALPPISLLKSARSGNTARSDADAQRQADIIETTLAHFGLAGKVVEIRRGPTVTQFGIEPGYLDRGAQNRDKALLKFRAAVAGALYDAIVVEPSVDRTAAVIEAPTALVDTREGSFKALLRSLLVDLDLSANFIEGERRSGRAFFEIGADTERKLKIKVGQISGLHRELAARLAERLFRFDDFAGSDQLIERLKISFPAGLADALGLKALFEDVMADLGLAGTVTLPRKASQAVIEWQKQAQKVRVGAIAALQNDFALALAAPSIRIEAPIPGRGLVGIEVPNIQVSDVDLRSLIESDAFRRIAQQSPLAIALGRDVSGTAICADLARMPHLLIAGTTGSGKSVCISAITMCLVMNNRPEDLKLVMIDPKMVELSRFAGLPHIIGKPESDIERIPAVLRWVTREMDARYKKFAEIGSRNLQEYNQAMERRGGETLPRIVVLIDELADLMLQSPIETEKTICRLAQMARATGIHLVVATQRPSVDVVTGLIKANFPARIAFAVASSTDSRVILDQIGAESLLGRGDMLFLNPEHGAPIRLQGCFVGDREVEEVLKWWKKQVESEGEAARDGACAVSGMAGVAGADEAPDAHHRPESETPWETVVAELAAERQQQATGKAGRGGGEDADGDDDLLQRAMEIIRTSGNASTSLLQRKLRIGYPRAARLMEELQEMGYVGSASRQAGKGREVLREDE